MIFKCLLLKAHLTIHISIYPCIQNLLNTYRVQGVVCLIVHLYAFLTWMKHHLRPNNPSWTFTSFLIKGDILLSRVSTDIIYEEYISQENLWLKIYYF